MSRQLFYNGLVYMDHRFQKLCVLTEDGAIAGIGEWISDPQAERIDLKGRRLTPGFLDILYGNPFGICAMTVCLTVYGAAYWMGKRIVEIEV